MSCLVRQIRERVLNFNPAYLAAILIVSALSFFGGLAYTGEQYIFWIFCVLANSMLCYGIFQKKSFVFMILCIFLWLGYWLKSVIHLLLDYPFREPMGRFSFSLGEWDEYYLTASFGMMMAIMSGIFFLQLSRRSTLDWPSFSSSDVRRIFSLHKIWLAGVLGVVLLCGLNYQLHFIAIGLHSSEANFPWIPQALISWMLGFGAISFFYSLLDLDLRDNTKFMFKCILVLFIFLLLSISQSSRSVMVLAGLPMFLGLMVVYKKPVKKVIPILLIYFLFIILSVYGSNYRRYEHGLNSLQNQTRHSSGLISSISVLVIDRWIGLEGLASVISYPNKSPELLLSSLTEKRVGGTIDSYTLNIAQAFKGAPLEKSDAIAKQYASIAGLFGFLYLAGSLPLLVLGIFMVVGLIIFSERVILSFTHNRMVTLFWSTSFVFTISSLTIGVPQIVRYYLFSFIAINVFGFLFRRYCYAHETNN